MFERVCVCLFLSTLKSTALELGMSELQNVKLFNNAKGQDGSATISSWASACVSPSALHAWWWFKPNSGRKRVSLWPLPSSPAYFWHRVPVTARPWKNKVETRSRVRGVFLDVPESPIQQLCGSGALLWHQGYCYSSSICYSVKNKARWGWGNILCCTPAHFPTTSSSQNTKADLKSVGLLLRNDKVTFGKWNKWIILL